MKKQIKMLLFALIIIPCVAMTVVACGAHKHSWSSDWSSDATHHWHDCTGSKCTDVKDMSEHVLDATWYKDANGHWKECDCGYESTKVTHTPSDWKVDVDATEDEDGSKYKECTDCGYILETEVIAKHTHVFTDWQVTTPATCGSNGVETEKCSACPALGTQTRVIDKSTISHNYSISWSTSATEHWHACTVCGDKKDVDDHISNNAHATDCTVSDKCTICDYSYSNATAHTSNDAHSSNCTVSDRCLSCGHIYNNATTHNFIGNTCISCGQKAPPATLQEFFDAIFTSTNYTLEIIGQNDAFTYASDIENNGSISYCINYENEWDDEYECYFILDSDLLFTFYKYDYQSEYSMDYNFAGNYNNAFKCQYDEDIFNVLSSATYDQNWELTAPVQIYDGDDSYMISLAQVTHDGAKFTLEIAIYDGGDTYTETYIFTFGASDFELPASEAFEQRIEDFYQSDEYTNMMMFGVTPVYYYDYSYTNQDWSWSWEGDKKSELQTFLGTTLGLTSNGGGGRNSSVVDPLGTTTITLMSIWGSDDFNVIISAYPATSGIYFSTAQYITDNVEMFYDPYFFDVITGATFTGEGTILAGSREWVFAEDCYTSVLALMETFGYTPNDEEYNWSEGDVEFSDTTVVHFNYNENSAYVEIYYTDGTGRGFDFIKS